VKTNRNEREPEARGVEQVADGEVKTPHVTIESSDFQQIRTELFFAKVSSLLRFPVFNERRDLGLG
jgi:hypothetical protein